MQDYHELPELINNDVLARASKFGSATLCDGMKDLGVLRDGCMDASMMPIDESMKMIGTACTVETADGDNFPIHVAIYQGRPGYVLIIDGKGYTEKPYMGDLMGSAANAIGFNGIVVDGYVRDKIGLKETKLPIFCKGFMQRSPAKKGPGKINTIIMCAGVEVNPGDLVVGDCDGVTVVPRHLIEKVLEAAEKKIAYEEKRRVAIREYEKCRKRNATLPNLAPDWVLEMMK